MAMRTNNSGGDPSESEEIIAEINITPLVDVFLVLLIIFMVTSSVMSQMGMEVNLPKASAQTTKDQPPGVIVTLLPSGGLKVNAQAIAGIDQLGEALTRAFGQTKSRTVILEGDRQAFLGSAIEVIDRAKQAGAESFAIATDPGKK